MSETSDANQALICRLFEEVVNQGDLALIDALYAPNVVDRNASPSESFGRENFRRALIEVRSILLDLHVEVDELRLEADTVSTRESWRGAHAVTGKRVAGTVTHIFRMAGGQIVEEWSGGWEWLD